MTEKLKNYILTGHDFATKKLISPQAVRITLEQDTKDQKLYNLI
jgi:hypothetical protein